MSTSANLPAGFSITSINGVRCTAVPRTANTVSSAITTAVPVPVSTSTSSSSSSSSSTSISSSSTSTSTSTPESATQTPQPTSTPVSVVPAVASSPVAVAVGGPVVQSSSTTTSAVEPKPTPPTPPPPPPPPPPAPTPVATTSSASQTQTTSTNISTTTSPSPASKGTTPTESSSTSIAIVQSQISTTATSGHDPASHDPATHDPSVGHATSVVSATASSTQSVESTAAGGISSLGRLMTAPVIGGILGGIGFLALIGLIIFCCRRRRKSKRNSLLTPLTNGTQDQFYDIDKKAQGQYYDIYDDSVGSAGRGTNFKAQIGGAATNFGAGLAGIGSTLKNHVQPGNKPTVNLDRGNSQFFEGPIPYHSRNNSSASAHALHYAAKDRADDFTNKVKGVFRKTPKEEQDPFAMARGISERQDFGNLMDMDDRNLLMKAERRRLSLSSNSGSGQMFGSLGLDFGIPQDPFADPASRNLNTNPFADPNKWDSISRPGPAIPRTSTYISDVRRSRGESLDSTTRGHKNAPSSVYGPAAYRTPSISNVSRYPSSIAPSTESFRDTLYSTASNINNTRRMAGRSDPFDLERPELWLPMLANSDQKSNSPAVFERGSDLYPDPLTMPTFKPGQAPVVPIQNFVSSDSRVASQGTYESKYSSRTSMGDWGDPGPDIGSGPSSLAGQGFYGMNGNMNQQWDVRRNADNVSPMSATSSKGGVGKAR
ncbi:uncharacterized protein EAE98_000038 [Botrytis deweyae]|uniref:Uncharacterized protein n=1 Tax=Botrytis deweyae TaxID=2478750 RepID=A0ABQ7J1P4_9HELO|nr:uncharacterized protein EAE98_000038 [Botrytis deweyae]KAF7939911.1 hypothetical protein EAE98_000038 [Botrytis deweyae]